MAWGALIYGYAAKADDITQMPQVDSYKTKGGRTVLIDNEDVHPIDEDVELWYSDRVVFGYFLGESGDELTLENMEDAKLYAKNISEAVKFFTGWDTDISDYGYHVCTIYD